MRQEEDRMVGPLLTLMQKQQDALVDYYLEVRDHCDWALKVWKHALD